MAEAVKLPSMMNRMLECCVCLQQYNTRDRLPKGLKCFHSTCAICLDSLLQNGQVTCPKCRRSSLMTEVGTNFSVLDVLEALCEECVLQERAIKCAHCALHLCGTCLEKHSRALHADIHNNIQILNDEISSCIDMSKDPSKIREAGQKAVDTIAEIDSVFDEYQQMLDQRREELKERVSKLREYNISTLVKWREGLDSRVARCKTFVDQSWGQLGEAYSGALSAEDMVGIQRQCSQLTRELVADKESQVDLEEYHFRASKDKLNSVLSDLGSICDVKDDNDMMSDEEESFSLAESTQDEELKVASALKDYNTAKVCATVGGAEGSGQDQFNKPWGIVALFDGHVAVTDSVNHRVKIYDANLNFIRMFGSMGKGPNEFNSPAGITLDSNGHMYICDRLNQRIQVCTVDGHFLHRFGSYGAGDKQLNNPLGIACKDDCLFICDKDNHRLQVVRTDGTFLRTFGTKDTLNESPFHVATASDGRVLVVEFTEKQKNLHCFTINGAYAGQVPFHSMSGPLDVAARGMDVDSSGNVIVADVTGLLHVMSKNGTFVFEIKSKDIKLEPFDITLDGRGNIFVSDYNNHQIVKFTIK